MLQENPQWRQKSPIIYVKKYAFTRKLCMCVTHRKQTIFHCPYVFDYPRFHNLSASVPYIIPQNGEITVFQILVSFNLIL